MFFFPVISTKTKIDNVITIPKPTANRSPQR